MGINMRAIGTKTNVKERNVHTFSNGAYYTGEWVNDQTVKVSFDWGDGTTYDGMWGNKSAFRQRYETAMLMVMCILETGLTIFKVVKVMA